MKKGLLKVILFVFALNLFLGFYAELASDQIDHASIVIKNNEGSEINDLLLKNQQMLKTLKISLVVLALLWGLSFYFFRLQYKSRKEREKRIPQNKALENLWKQQETELQDQQEDQGDFSSQFMISREQYESLFEDLHEGMVIVDAEENFQFVNNYALDIYGCNKQDMIGHNVSEFTDDLEFNKILEQTSLRKKGIASKYELIIRQPSGEKRIVKVSANPIFQAGEFKGSVGVFVDVTEQKKNELIQEVIYNISTLVNTPATMTEMYKKIHIILDIVIDTTNFYIALYDPLTNIIHTPHYVDQLTRTIPQPQMMGKGLTAHVIHSGKSLYLTEKKRNEMIRSGVIPKGEWKSKIWLGVPLKIQDEVIGAIAVQSYDNADQYNRKDLWLLEFVSDQIALAISRKRAEKALRESETFNRAVIENSPLAISARDNNGRLLIANKAWMELWEKSDSDLELDTRERAQFQLDERDDYLGEFRSRIEEIYKQGGDLYISELQVKRKRSALNTIWISMYFYALKKDSGEVDKVIIITENITDRKQAQEQLKTSLSEKEILLKELHHRVKNNMQVISSMLKLQARYIEDEKSLELFLESHNRVKTMALIHEKLYQSENFKELDFDQYIKMLISHLLSSFSTIGCEISTVIESNHVKLDMTKAIPCGLIINELISNSLKHAFPGRKKGKITLKTSKVDDNYILQYSDDGRGFPEDIDFRDTDSLGMQLVIALIKQLHGEITMNRHKGTEFRLVFPEE